MHFTQLQTEFLDRYESKRRIGTSIFWLSIIPILSILLLIDIYGASNSTIHNIVIFGIIINYIIHIVSVVGVFVMTIGMFSFAESLKLFSEEFSDDRSKVNVGHDLIRKTLSVIPVRRSQYVGTTIDAVLYFILACGGYYVTATIFLVCAVLVHYMHKEIKKIVIKYVHSLSPEMLFEFEGGISGDIATGIKNDIEKHIMGNVQIYRKDNNAIVRIVADEIPFLGIDIKIQNSEAIISCDKYYNTVEECVIELSNPNALHSIRNRVLQLIGEHKCLNPKT